MHFSAICSIFILPLTVAATGSHAGNNAKRHHEHVARKNVQTFNITQPLNLTERSVEKRGFNNARFTFYDAGLGACGKVNQASDFIVALTATQFGGGYPGPNCFRPIRIEYGGKTADAVIMDECMICPYGGLDFSRGLFNHFASEGQGVIYGSWFFTDEGDNGDTQTTTSKPPAPKTTKTTTHAPTPTTTSTTHTRTSTKSTSTSTSTSSNKTSSTVTSTSSATSTSAVPSTSTVTSTLSVDVSEGVASGIAQTTVAEAPIQTANDVLNLLNNGVVYLGALLVAGFQAEN